MESIERENDEKKKLLKENHEYQKKVIKLFYLINLK